MKRIILTVLLALILAMSAPAVAESSSSDWANFSVTTTDGATLTLSDILKEKDIVVLNIFTSWCPPCRMEFPEMEAVYRDLSDRMEIVAVSDEPDDTLEVIAQYKADLGLSFPMGLAADAPIADFIQIEGYPTTLVIDKSGAVGYFQLGSFVSESQFRGVVDYFLSAHYDGTPLHSYNVYVCDQHDEPVPGVTVQFCDTACRLYTSDAEGIITFVGKPARYSIHVTGVPEGYRYDESFEAVCDGSGEWVIVEIEKE